VTKYPVNANVIVFCKTCAPATSAEKGWNGGIGVLSLIEHMVFNRKVNSQHSKWVIGIQVANKLTSRIVKILDWSGQRERRD